MKKMTFLKKRNLWILSAMALTFVAAHERADHGKYFEISKNIEIYTTLYKELNTYYVDDLDPSKLMRTGSSKSLMASEISLSLRKPILICPFS